jgi:hypothetical protein
LLIRNKPMQTTINNANQINIGVTVSEANVAPDFKKPMDCFTESDILSIEKTITVVAFTEKKHVVIVLH